MKRIAFFDFDGTLTCKDTFLYFILKYINPFRILYTALLNFPFILGFKLGIYSNEKAKHRLFKSLFKNVKAQTFFNWGEEFHVDINGMLNKKGMEKLEAHLRSGDDVYIVSASISAWIKPWALQHGVKEVISTEIEIDNKGLLTGNFSTPNCHGKEKVRRILNKIPDIEEYETYSYGDSDGDREMFNLTNHHTFIK